MPVTIILRGICIPIHRNIKKEKEVSTENNMTHAMLWENSNCNTFCSIDMSPNDLSSFACHTKKLSKQGKLSIEVLLRTFFKELPCGHFVKQHFSITDGE